MKELVMRLERIGAQFKFLLATSLLFFAGCFPLPKYSPPDDALVLADSPARCHELYAPDNQLQSLRALVDVTLRRKDESASFRYAIIARQPDAFRVDLLPDTGAFTLGMLVTNAGTTTILDAQEKSFLRGKNETELIENFLQIPGFSRTVVIGIVSGFLPVIDCNRVVVRARPGGEYLIEDSVNSVVWYFDTLTRMVKGVTGVTPGGKGVRYEIRRVGDAPQEGDIAFNLFDPVEATASMEVKKITINGKLGDELFRVVIPGSYRDRS